MNEHKDLEKPFWVAKKEDNSVLKYGELMEGNILNTKMTIYTFETKQEMIDFIEANGHEYIDEEIK
jgi:hypothetical protein